MKINWKIRVKNPYFWVGLLGVILAAVGVSPETFTTWGVVADQLKAVAANPFVLGGIVMAVLGVIYDPTTAGVSDSAQALDYNKPKDDVAELAEHYTDDRR